ncbi:hypothetical protein H5J24_18165 [Chryseobacterium capnotolerans]|uniref:hypothetical protein n=1 Tax=Chryseobacterium TaxID=59732 RepID=UPI00083B2C1F|nr:MULTISPECIES: hypothetical protein [Chryseobacterium]UHO37583.1 hypothetical protein H5J24_18165 [Chryseobacterium capnotolerans]
MSRTRIVKGTYTKISQEGHSMYSNENIITTAGNSITETGVKDGVSYGIPKYAPGIELPAKCLVQFRAKDHWKGEDYGFDWMRLGETSNFGDKNYKEVVAEQYKKSKDKKDKAFTTLETDPNEYEGDFKTSSSLFARLRNEYGVYSIPWKKKADGSAEDYFCSWLSLYPSQIKDESGNLTASGFSNTKALLSLIVEVDEEPQILIFKENPHFKIDPMEITTKSKGKHDLKDYVTIECLEEFFVDQDIEVYAVSKNEEGKELEQLAGKLKVWANDASKRKKAKALLVEIKTPEIILTKGERKGMASGQKELFEKYLRHALIEIEVETYSLDLSSDSNLQSGGKYVEGRNILAYYDNEKHIPSAHVKGYMNLAFYLNGKLKEDLKNKKENEYKYSKYFVAFYLGENGGCMDKSNAYKGLNGYALNDFVILFPGKSNETAAHEFLHTKGIPHSFTNNAADSNAEYTYIYGMTENIMDYSHINEKLRYSLWKWQWQKTNSKITNL